MDNSRSHDSGNLDRLRSEGDLNISPQRRKWAEKKIDAETRRLLAEDEKYFLRQSLSTPCLNVLSGCEGPKLSTARAVGSSISMETTSIRSDSATLK